MNSTQSKRPITILLAALGGEGGSLLAEWIVEAAQAAGYPVQSTSIPGVAQRTGATTYYVEIWPEFEAQLGARQPILSLAPVPGSVDLLVASELLEAVRQVSGGMVSPDRTWLITSSHRSLTTAERMQPGDGRFDPQRLLDVARSQSRNLVSFDMDAAAREAETIVSAVMFGAIGASGILPLARDVFEAVVRASGRGVQASLRGFARGWAETAVGGASAAPPLPSTAVATVAVAGFPAQVSDIVALGTQRLIEYQDAGYADLYRQRVQRILDAEKKADTEARHSFAMTREAARFLALWMAFDDIVRVADLKSRARRFQRVRREVRAEEGDLVRIIDHFKPGVPEMAGLLPAPLARRLLAWDKKRRAAGKAPLAFALHLRSSSMTGFLALRLLAGLRWLRRGGVRFAEEQALIGQWLAAVEAAAARSWEVANELALCGRLVKGYGSTHDRSRDNLCHIIAHLSGGPAAAVRAAREAALADEGGTALDQTLQAHGAPPRPVKAQPVTWLPPRPKPTAGTSRH